MIGIKVGLKAWHYNFILREIAVTYNARIVSVLPHLFSVGGSE